MNINWRNWNSTAAVAGMALAATLGSVLVLVAAENAAKPGGRNAGKGELGAEDYHAVAPVIAQIVTHLNLAAKQIEENQPDQAGAEIRKAETLFQAVHNLMPAKPETEAGEAAFPGRLLGRHREPARPGARGPAPFPFDGDEDGWDPFAEMQAMREQIGRLFDDSFNRMSIGAGDRGWDDPFVFSPQMDITEQDGKYVVKVDMPGTDKSSIKVNVEDRLLTISGQSRQVVEEKKGDKMLRRERRAGQFQRALTLPGPVEADKMEARYENGVLTVTVPKAKDDKPIKNVPVY